MSTSVVRTTQEYLRERAKSVKVDRDTSAAGGIRILHFLDIFNIGISGGSTSEKEEGSTFRALSTGRTEVALARAACFTHDLSVSAQTTRPLFTGDFVRGLENLDGMLRRRRTSEAERRGAYVEFVRHFGTHYVRKAQFGSTVSVERVFRGRSRTEAQMERRRECFAESTNACVFLGARLSKVASESRVPHNGIRTLIGNSYGVNFPSYPFT